VSGTRRRPDPPSVRSAQRRARRVAVLLVLPVVALLGASTVLPGCGGSVLPQVHDESGRLDLARRLYAKGDAGLAIEALAPFSTSGSGSANVDEAVYLLGLCHLKQKEYATAQTDFERMLRDYPESDSAPSASFRMGEAYWGQSRGPDFDQEYTLRALDQWMQFRRDHPDHWLAAGATRRIAEARTRLATKLYRTGDLYVKLKEFDAARGYFHDVMTEYSETTLYGDALIGWALASARLGERDTALVLLQNLQEEYKGQELGQKAGRAIGDLNHWKGTYHGKRRSAPNEPPPPPSQSGGGSITP
jgi:outer membrane assembly lipoprotein YfiO